MNITYTYYQMKLVKQNKMPKFDGLTVEFIKNLE